MRIISGTLKGRLINFLKNSGTRPLKDNVRESIFNILKHSNLVKTKIKNSNILDLYSGTGSFGIECISRGAKKVNFVENDTNAFSILNENLISLSILNKSYISNNKVENILNKDIKDKFHIIFLDPPFKDITFIQNLKLIKEKKIFMKEHMVIVHRDRKAKDNYENLIEIIETKKYGRSKIIFGIFI